ncbi:histidine phosphatase family protein [Sphingorhabdus sp. Alg239-R122]|uniref:histidine phosphatase family protein n=1 Tax=Sphingorhabdus sp. Alg239-R122 TaxID=2305989 RepID=UPI0013DCBAB9|nr:histidine phosphatase family protein [Sphingorhabdus sp. Alg239-R122]
MPSPSPYPVKGRFFIARHGETVFNAAARLQGDALHTPLTRAGFVQADTMGKELRAYLGATPDIELHVSSAGRALQTLAIIAEHLELDWHSARGDDRLKEIGMGSYGGKYYAYVAENYGDIIDRETMLLRPAPDGENYVQIADRLKGWLGSLEDNAADRLVIMHGISSRVLRGILCGLPGNPDYGAPIAGSLTQGSVVCIENGTERVTIEGQGGQRA